ncbi:MAG: M48 family metallopeptidase [Candidatus ainarchaeum sp.]|nr:M48 family metallopeptidase [Candidatus ainarchaeum sp.]MDD5095911.1 M48 family metallopeptidase [Candidatus ainarchaeum sp.]
MATNPMPDRGNGQRVSFFDAIDANKRNSLLLIVFLTVLVFLAISAFALMFDMGWVGFVMGALIAVLYALFSYFLGDRALLALSGARPVSREENPYLYNLVEGLAIAAQIPAPRVYMMDDASLNAFATGRDPQHSAIVVTRGLAEKMNRAELEGVVAHEMSHIGNYDIRYMLITVVMVGLIGFLGEIMLRSFLWGGSGNRGGRGGGGMLVLLGLVLAILTPIIALLVKLAISREREYLADATAVKLTRYPDGLRNALIKIRDNYQPTRAATGTTASLYFADPIGKKAAGLLATHPPIEDRIKRLGGF